MTINITFLDRETLANNVTLRRPRFSHQWYEYPFTPPQKIIARLAGCDIVIVNKVQLAAETLSQLPKLKMIAIAATGTNNVDLDYCQRTGITVNNVTNYATRSVPEHCLGMMLALRRNLPAYSRDIDSGEWQRSRQFCFFNHPINDLSGTCLGIIGAGNLGRSMASLAEALGMNVLFAEHKGRSTCRVGYTPFADVIARCDVISLHCPLTPETQDLITLNEFQRMKSSALLINAARGGLVNEEDLCTALNEGLIAGAGFDVLSTEPPTDRQPLLKLTWLSNFILTPHIAWASQEAMQALADQLIDNIEQYIANTRENGDVY